MLKLSPDLQASVSAQNQLVRNDLPSRFASITVVALLSLYYLPFQTVSFIYLGIALIELVGIYVYNKLKRKVTFAGIALFTGSAFIGILFFNSIPMLLFFQPEAFPKLAGTMLLVIALNHSVVARSEWMFFGLLTAVPIICAVGFMIVSFLHSFASPVEIGIAVVILVLGAGYIAHSMRSLNQMTDKLRHALSDAEAGSRAKSSFLAAMSHEIRTPLNAICGMAELIDEEDTDPETQQERTLLLRKSAQALTGILNDVLDHAKVESGHIEVNLTAASPRVEIANAVEVFRAPAEAKGLHFDLSFVEDIPSYAQFDAQRLRQVIGNLVSNAVKFTEAGHITVNVTAQQVEDQSILTIQVLDTGRGIASNQIPHLFTEFYRAVDKNAPTVPGTGLGLAIARRFARMMGGDISISSVPKQGSCFTFTCQIKVLEEPKASQDHSNVQSITKATQRTDQGADQDLGLHTILLVDDTQSNRMVVRSFLKKSNVEIIEAEDGSKAMKCLEQRPVDLVLLDMKMPVMDGEETLTEMTRRGGRIAETPVVMLTANAAPEDRQRFLALGALGYIAKPVKKSVLLSEIRRIAALTHETKTAAQQAAPTAAPCPHTALK
ncbi:ATP-binding protein [Pseudophaeobacter sp. EL27]|uniref:ATP-binding protein n=1 Tax=Pseudophaeobacter sp. EL27 TaxID=2107580 RepID=UPI000EFB9424|nr:ATP-binding protein [Pseudophaeobacter sp. EL27]